MSREFLTVYKEMGRMNAEIAVLNVKALILGAVAGGLFGGAIAYFVAHAR